MPAFKSTGGFALVEGAAIARYREYGITTDRFHLSNRLLTHTFSLRPRTGIWTPSEVS